MYISLTIAIGIASFASGLFIGFVASYGVVMENSYRLLDKLSSLRGGDGGTDEFAEEDDEPPVLPSHSRYPLSVN